MKLLLAIGTSSTHSWFGAPRGNAIRCPKLTVAAAPASLARSAWPMGNMHRAGDGCVVASLIALATQRSRYHLQRGPPRFRQLRRPNWRRPFKLATCTVLSIVALLGFARVAAASFAVNNSSPLLHLVAWLRTELSGLMDLIRRGPQRDILALLLATSLVVPFVKSLKGSPIIGFLIMGVLMGPSGMNLIADLQTTHILGELGIIFSVFEIGLELSVEKVMSMSADVFGLGMTQYFLSGVLISSAAAFIDPSLSGGALVVLGGALALSSSAFVLELIRDSGQLGTRYGRASFGILLFQDIAVVPLLVVVPILAQGGSKSIASGLIDAGLRGGVGLTMIFALGKFVLDKMFFFVSRFHSHESFLAISLGTVLFCSSLTDGLGLSHTLGAFLGGVLLSETAYRHQVEADIAPFRGLLLGVFFTTVGFSIDIPLLLSSWQLMLPIIVGLLILKTAVVLMVGSFGGLPFIASLQAALLLAPGGELAFVVLGLAQNLKLLPVPTAQLLVTAIAITMSVIPILGVAGENLAELVRERRQSYKGTDNEAVELFEKVTTAKKGFIVIVGFGRIGRTICQLLDVEGAFEYIAFEKNPTRAIQARSRGLPVFMADCANREVIENFGFKKARLAVVAVDDKSATNRIARSIRQNCPNLEILARAASERHEKALQATVGCNALVPKKPAEIDVLMALPFGAEVLRRLGFADLEVDNLVKEERRKLFGEGATGLVAPEKFEKLSSRDLRQAFGAFDTDGTGSIDASELTALLNSLKPSWTDSQIQDFVREVDKSIDGKLTLHDFEDVIRGLSWLKWVEEDR